MFTASWSIRDFYKYAFIFLFSITIVSIGILFQYYKKVSYFKQHINDLNELRAYQVKAIREKAQHVKLQRQKVNEILAEDENFKIGGYFKILLEKLHLTEKKVSEETGQIGEREDIYREIELNAKLEDMNMKQLTQLLQEIEQNKRIFTKKLVIIQSKKTPHTIETEITIATLLPKTSPIE